VFGVPFGALDAGAPADFLVGQAFTRTPLDPDNWLSLMLFGFHASQIAAVYVGGRRVYRAGDPAPIDVVRCQAAARRVWDGMRGGRRGAKT
ncbi:MAG: hypothetical protein ACYDIE_14515, partial [Candidatus Krumholzibacteriia bacterium]